ncbi:MAG TPA: SIMPL domain-containing protein [Vicinamibacterales bacterium]|nr:SIMPL domain-containing protein [Vicinamibacterales bacterium]
MSRLTRAAVIMLALACPAAALAQESTANPSVIVTTGEATISVAPDRAVVQIAAEGRAQKAGEAQRLAADAMTSLLGALKGVGLPADAVKTTGYTLNPENDFVNGRQSFRDYLARNQIQVQVDDLARLSAIIDASGASGASVVTGLRFDVKNRATVEQTALKQAVGDAMARASVIAAGANRTVGAIVRIQEQRITPPAYYNFDSFTAGAGGGRGGGTPVEPGQIDVRAQVTLTVAIK